MTTTPRHVMDHLPASTADGHVVLNTALETIDTLLHLNVLDRNQTSPPAAENGEAYIVASPATGAWEGWENCIAVMSEGEWKKIDPVVGMRAWVEDDNIMAVWTGVTWESRAGGNSVSLGSSAGQTIDGGGTAIQWNEQFRKDGPYTHDTSSDSQDITLIEEGDYLVTVDVTVDYGTGTGEQRYTIDLALDGTPVSGSTAYGSVNADTDRNTTSLTMVVSATENQVLTAIATHVAGGGTITALADACRISVRRL